jgi:hypothetical protein
VPDWVLILFGFLSGALATLIALWFVPKAGDRDDPS